MNKKAASLEDLLQVLKTPPKIMVSCIPCGNAGPLSKAFKPHPDGLSWICRKCSPNPPKRVVIPIEAK